ncbi:Alanine--tRNA ligase [subsurface metagenome]
MIRIGSPPISAELCGGTHVTSTGEIGFFHIFGEHSIGAGLRRIEAVTGRGAERYINQRLLDLEKIAKHLNTEPDEVVNQAQSLSAELKNERKRVQSLESKLAKSDVADLEKRATDFRGITVLAEKVNDNTAMDTLREMSDMLKDKLGSATVVVLGTIWEDKPAFVVNVSPDLVKRGYKAGEIVKKVAEVAGGSGGGKATIAQGGGKDKVKLNEALKQVEKYIEEKES